MAPGPLATALQGHDMFLYFGHGSGDQYLSARYRALDHVIFDYQLHPLHSHLLLKKQCCAQRVAQLLCPFWWKPALCFGSHIAEAPGAGLHIYTHMSLVSVPLDLMSKQEVM